MNGINKDAADWTGGCQCGAVRYQLLTPPEHACICHCRMCQRASGQPFMAFASVKRENLRWTRGYPSTFVSSNVAERNFCSACGTPLTYHRMESGSIAVTQEHEHTSPSSPSARFATLEPQKLFRRMSPGNGCLKKSSGTEPGVSRELRSLWVSFDHHPLEVMCASIKHSGGGAQ